MISLLVLAHIAIFTLKPLRQFYVSWLPASAGCSIGLVAGLLVGAWLVSSGLPAWTLPVNAVIWAIGGARLPRELGWKPEQ